MKKIYDISLTITANMPVWPGDPQVVLERFSKMEEGAACNVSRMALGVHTGTHMDAPYHFVDGALTIEDVSLEKLIGPVYAAVLPESCMLITADDLNKLKIPEECKRIIFKTRNSSFWQETPQKFRKDFTAISADGAQWLVEHGTEFVGVDYLSVAPFGDGVPTHRVLLTAGVLVLEGLNLSEVAEGWYELICLPLKLGASDGAPARAILLKD